MAGYFRPLLTWLVCAVCYVGLSPLPEAYAAKFEIGEGGFCPGGTWDVSTSTCTTSGFTVGEGDSVIIPNGVTLINAGILDNFGTLTNASALFNNGSLDNTGALTNAGVLENFGALDNTGTLINCGIFTDTGTLTGSSIMPCEADGDGRAD
jgi:hypothetical protein